MVDYLSKRGVPMAIFLRAAARISKPVFVQPVRCLSNFVPKFGTGPDALSAYLADPEVCNETTFKTVVYALHHLLDIESAGEAVIAYVTDHDARFRSKSYNYMLLESALDPRTKEGLYTLANAEFNFERITAEEVLHTIRVHTFLSMDVRDLFLDTYFPKLENLKTNLIS